MSDLAKTIDRLEQWVEYSAPHYPPEFIADLRALLNTAKAAQRAVELLESAEDTVTMDEDGGLAVMVCAHLVDHAVAILKGECNE